MAADDWLELTDGSFKGFLFHVAMPTRGLDSHGAEEISVNTGRRIHKIERPFVDGQRTLDLGAIGDEISAKLVFFGPTYLDRFEDFKRILNQRDPITQKISGTLILPDRRESLKATFSKMSETSRAGEVSSKSVVVTWMQDEVSAQEVAIGAASGLIPQGVLDAVESAQNVVSAAGRVLRNNPVLATLRQFDQIQASAASSVVTSVALGAAARRRILTSEANLLDTYSTIVTAALRIGSLFGGEEDASGFESGRVDSQTGQPLEDAADAEVTEAVDSLARPDTEPDQTVDIISLQTIEGLDQFEKDTLDLLADMDIALSGDTDGRTNDISDSITDVRNAVRDLVQSAKPDPERLIVTPFELSLSEIMFINSVDLNTLDSVLERNSFIDDIHVVPRGSVVRL